MNEIVGKCGISARVICDSVSANGERLTTFELVYPRIVHSEFMTHRMISRNAASSRAIPFAKMSEQLTGRPVRFGHANPGMQDKGADHDGMVWGRASAEEAWEEAKDFATSFAKGFYDAGYHKQVLNRLTEAFQMIKVVATATEWHNFFWLRDHEAADPTIRELARVMREAAEQAHTVVLKPGEWHLPYVNYYRDVNDVLHYGDFDNLLWTGYELEDAIKISCARCAAVSFRNVDYDLEKSKQVYDRLVGDARKHASAFEHCATPMKPRTFGIGKPDWNHPGKAHTWQEGVTHMDREGGLWSGNLKGFIQYRKLIPGENYTG